MLTRSSRLSQTLVELISLPSTPGHEGPVRSYMEEHLLQLGLPTQVDAAGNLIATLPGEGRPLLLNAHMDRVPPGLGHTPVLRDGILYSDGTTNLGADDAAGLAIILEILTRLQEDGLPHPPLVLVFTVQEEVGMHGASVFDPTPWKVSEGIVFDNAFEAGVVVSQGAAYVAFDIEISGKTGHPGKDLSQTINVLEILRAARYPHGSLNNDQTRILLSRISAGSARNAIPASAHIEGELRSFESPEARQGYLQAIQQAFEDAARQYGGKVSITLNPHCTSYTVSEEEPLLGIYREVLAHRGETLRLQPTFIGSDAAAFRPQVKAFTISTGVVNEHSPEEYIPLTPLETIVNDILMVFQLHQSD
ncbi:MAG TPA: M20/M25/M40 family metallo-hydrolase [Ktedonobacteraceae bacterium]|nr:M20/M25/M40 family metallo-hydrolase [Ktedonobacteraceae bacterium]